MRKKTVESDPDKNMLPRLKSLKKLCSIAGFTDRLPALDEFIDKFADANNDEELIQRCSEPIRTAQDARALMQALDSVGKDNRKTEHAKYFIEGRSHLYAGMASFVDELKNAEATPDLILPWVEASGKINDCMNIAHTAGEASAPGKLASAIVHAKASAQFMSLIGESSVSVRTRADQCEKAV